MHIQIDSWMPPVIVMIARQKLSRQLIQLAGPNSTMCQLSGTSLYEYKLISASSGISRWNLWKLQPVARVFVFHELYWYNYFRKISRIQVRYIYFMIDHICSMNFHHMLFAFFIFIIHYSMLSWTDDWNAFMRRIMSWHLILKVLSRIILTLLLTTFNNWDCVCINHNIFHHIWDAITHALKVKACLMWM